MKGSVSPCGLAGGCSDGGTRGERGETVIGVNTVTMSPISIPHLSFWLYTQASQAGLVCSLGDSSGVITLDPIKTSSQ